MSEHLHTVPLGFDSKHPGKTGIVSARSGVDYTPGIPEHVGRIDIERRDAPALTVVFRTGTCCRCLGYPDIEQPLMLDEPRNRPQPFLEQGMYIIQEIILEHDGCVAVNTLPDRGTCITIRLPCKERQA